MGDQAAIADLPIELSEALRVHQRPVQAARADVELDSLPDQRRATRFLKDCKPAIEGRGGDAWTVQTASKLHDLGVSEAVALELMDTHWNDRCEPPWDPDELAIKISNAYRYAQNEPGCNSVGGEIPEVWQAIAAEHAQRTPDATFKRTADTPEWRARVDRFRALEPDEYADLPEPEFWDDDGILPKMPGGCVGVAYGASGVGKTTMLATILVEAMRRREAHVAYCAGEGAYALRKMRVPAVCEAQGITPRDLRGKLQLGDQVPNLSDALDTDALIEAQASFKPDIVVIDTLATAIPGADENAASTGTHLTGNGAGGRLAKAFGAAVIFVAHSGKDQARGVRGSSAFTANADFVWEITSDKEAGTARLRVRKMRDGPDGFSVYFKVSPASNGVPVARRIDAGEYRALSAAGMSADRHDVAQALRRLGSEPVNTHVLASMLIPMEPNQRAEDHEHLVKVEGKRLQRLARAGANGALGPLAGYVAHESAYRGDPMLWGLPSALSGTENDGGDDE